MTAISPLQVGRQNTGFHPRVQEAKAEQNDADTGLDNAANENLPPGHGMQKPRDSSGVFALSSLKILHLPVPLRGFSALLGRTRCSSSCCRNVPGIPTSPCRISRSVSPYQFTFLRPQTLLQIMPKDVPKKGKYSSALCCSLTPHGGKMLWGEKAWGRN